MPFLSVNDPLLGGGKGEKEKVFTIFGRVSLGFTVGIIIFCVGSIVGQVGQSIGLPLFLAALIEGTGLPAYFVLWGCSFCFTIVFGIGAIFLVKQGAVDPEMRQWKWHKYMAVVGFFDAMNGILVVYSAFLSRVPGPVGAILSNCIIIFTMVMSKPLLHKTYTTKQMFGAFLVLVGIVVSLVPTFQSIGAAGPAAAWWWPLISIMAYIPGALMNVIQEYMQDKYRVETISPNKRYSVIYFQAVESFYQFLSICFFFWTDLIPGFGLSGDMGTFLSTFSFDIRCFFGVSSAVELAPKCSDAGGIGLLFISSYLIMYVFGTELTMYASANLGAVIGSLPPLIVAVFWFVFPSVNAWAGGAPLTNVDLGYNLGAFPFIIAGVIMYRLYEAEDKAPDSGETLEGGVELCW